MKIFELQQDVHHNLQSHGTPTYTNRQKATLYTPGLDSGLVCEKLSHCIVEWIIAPSAAQQWEIKPQPLQHWQWNLIPSTMFCQ